MDMVPSPNPEPQPPTPLSAGRLAEIESVQLGHWLSGEWKCRYVDGEPARYELFHVDTGQVLATLPDWAAGLATWVADAHAAVPELLGEYVRLQAERDELAELKRRVMEELEEFEDAAASDPSTPPVARNMIALFSRALRGGR